MNKTEAAIFLGVSVRAVERYASGGRLPSRYVRGKTGQVLDFQQSDLEALKTELETPVEKATTGHAEDRQGAPESEVRQGASKALARLDGANSVALVQFMEALASASFDKGRQAELVAISDKLLLTANEAAAFAGVGRRAIDNAIKAGQLTAHRGLGQGRRIKRADLEAWVKKL